MNHAIIGAGALGLGLAQLLGELHSHIDLIGRGDRIPKNCDFYWITTKAYDVEGALTHLLNQDFVPRCVAVLANGNHLKILKSFQEKFPQTVFCVGAVTFGSSFMGDSKDVALTGVGPGCIQIGSVNGNEIKVANPYIETKKNIPDVIQEKWFVNTVVNSLCGAYRLPRNGLLMQLQDDVKKAGDETYQLGIELFGGWKKSKEELLKLLNVIVERTSENENSMARDCRLYRRTETDFFAGLAVGRDGYAFLKMLHGVLV